MNAPLPSLDALLAGVALPRPTHTVTFTLGEGNLRGI
jgi:hypothetical protein